LGSVVFTSLLIYAPQVGLSDAAKEQCYDQLKNAMSKIPAPEVLLPLGDGNGHVGTETVNLKKHIEIEVLGHRI
jgi:hypothetical protein